MSKLFCIGLSVGILAGIWTFSSGLWGMVTYVGFLSWASYYASGCGLSGLRSTLLTNISGVLWAAVIILAYGYLSTILSSSFALAISVSIFAAAMVWQAHWKYLAFIPGTFIGCSTYFATNFELIDSVVGLVLGALLGIVSDKLGEFMYRQFSLNN